MASMSRETCLLPAPEGEPRPSAKNFSFISECFYLTHRALTLGLGAARGKAQRLYQDIGMMQARLGPDARNEDVEQSMARWDNALIYWSPALVCVVGDVVYIQIVNNPIKGAKNRFK